MINFYVGLSWYLAQERSGQISHIPHNQGELVMRCQHSGGHEGQCRTCRPMAKVLHKVLHISLQSLSILRLKYCDMKENPQYHNLNFQIPVIPLTTAPLEMNLA